MRSKTILAAGDWDVSLAIDHVRLDYDRRHRRRMLLRTESGREVLLDLAQAARLRGGDGLLLDDGGIVRVEARAEALAELAAPHAAAMIRIAWHLGNRHLPVQLVGDRLHIRTDAVIEDMVRRLGGEVRPIEAPFDPEGGAYAAGHNHPHDNHPHDNHPHGDNDHDGHA